MNVTIFKTTEEIGQAAGLVFAAQILRKPTTIMGLATGTSPIPLYQYLAELCQKGILDFSQVSSYNLDEYVGLAGDHPQSYRYFMDKYLFNNINIKTENTHLLNGLAADTAAECVAYDAAIESAGGLDIQILGIGNNGHIGFNEPDTVFTPETHKVELTESTIQANARLFDHVSEVPVSALSMGVGAIMKAKTIVLVATGAQKAVAVKRMVQGPVDPDCQASVLQLHKNVSVFLDEAAAAML